MRTIDWVVVPVNRYVPNENHLVSNVYYPARKWLLMYNPEDEQDREKCEDIRNILGKALIDSVSLEADVNNYYEVLIKFDEWLQTKQLDKDTIFVVNGATASIPAMNAVRDTLTRRGYGGFVFSFKGEGKSISGLPQISPLSTSTLTDEHLEIIKVLLKRGGRIQSQKELLQHLIETHKKAPEKTLGKRVFAKYESDQNSGMRVLSYHLQQLKKLSIVKTVYGKNKRQFTILLNIS